MPVTAPRHYHHYQTAIFGRVPLLLVLLSILPFCVSAFSTNLPCWTSHDGQSSSSIGRRRRIAIRSHHAQTESSAIAAARSSATPTQEEEDVVIIRDCLYAELGNAVDVIMASFYAETKSPWNHFYRLAELNRLQQGFPYADRAQHRMLVALDGSTTTGTNGAPAPRTIIGYCDCDVRVPNQTTAYKFNPRPYVSDLCVLPSYRRKGIAKMLVQYCEEYCREELGKQEIYIRVERKNAPALAMYGGLGYVDMDNPLDDSETIVILRKKFD